MRLVSVGTTAKILGVSRPTIINWIKSKKLSAIRLPSGHYRIPLSEIEKILRGDNNEDTETATERGF